MDDAQERMEAFHSTLHELDELRMQNPERNAFMELLLEAFDHLDSNSNRWLSLQELCNAVCGVQMDDKELVNYFTSMDEDHDGKIDPVEFVKFVSHNAISDEVSKAPTADDDKDGDDE